MAGSSYIVILTKSWKGLELVSQSPALNQKHVRNVRHTALFGST